MRRWRAMTDQEVSELEAAGRMRKGMHPETRNSYPTPEAANASIAGALYWTILTFWQDRPLILVVGLTLVMWQIGALVVSAF